MSYLICLYVYYHGNNLHRFGFVRGSLPTEEERNKGLQYEDVLGLMSENDREYFQGSGFSNYEQLTNNIDIRAQIENRGMVGQDELHRDADIHVNTGRDILSKMTPYERKMYEEMRQAELESAYFDKTHGLQKNYEMMNDDIEEDFIDLLIFDDLNN